MQYFFRGCGLLLAVLLATSLAACGSLSHDIANDGASAEQLVWPKPDDTTPLHKGGTYPSLGNLRLIQAGMDKGQVTHLIGYPHFSEGRWRVREWNYLFNFKTDTGVKQCEFKVLFDKDYLAQSFYWHPASCGNLLHPQETTDFQLAADALFAFNSATIKRQGQAKLDELAAKIKQHLSVIQHIRIVGYTDVMGSKSYNLSLSRQRASAVLLYLSDEGVPTGLMTAIGMGESHPIKTDCDVNARRGRRIACMAPNRRVVVQVDRLQSDTRPTDKVQTDTH